MDKVLDCDILVSEFELQSRYHVHFRTKTFRKYMISFILSSYGLNSCPTGLLHGFSIKWHMKFDMPLNKET